MLTGSYPVRFTHSPHPEKIEKTLKIEKANSRPPHPSPGPTSYEQPRAHCKQKILCLRKKERSRADALQAPDYERRRKYKMTRTTMTISSIALIAINGSVKFGGGSTVGMSGTSDVPEMTTLSMAHPLCPVNMKYPVIGRE
jgi:hypothetical protein